MQSLSFILHPCHEALTPETDDIKCQSPKNGEQMGQPLLDDACRTLGLTTETVDRMYVDALKYGLQART